MFCHVPLKAPKPIYFFRTKGWIGGGVLNRESGHIG